MGEPVAAPPQILPLSIVKPPDRLDMNTKNMSQVWKKWKEEFVLYTELAMADREETIKIKMLLYLIGNQGREIYETLQFDSELADRTLAEVIEAFDGHCDPRKNETVERYRFFTRSQESGESIDKYATELKILAATYNFEQLQNSLIRDRIVCGIRDASLRERLLRENQLTLEKCMHICRASEISKEQVKTLESPAVHAVKRKQYASRDRAQTRGKNRYRKPAYNDRKPAGAYNDRKPTGAYNAVKTGQCRYCGRKHEFKRDKCPAFGQMCRKCNTQNHFEKMCVANTTQRRVHHLDNNDWSDDDDEDDFFEIKSLELTTDWQHINQVTGKDYPKQIYATMLVDGRPIKFQIDSGATCNIIPAKDLGNLENYNMMGTDQVLSTTRQH